MSSDAGEKTEDPTPRRQREARRNGEVPQSRDFSATLALLAGMAAIWACRSAIIGSFAGLFDAIIDGVGSRDEAAGWRLIGESLGAIARALAPIPIAVVVTGTLSSFLQVGALMTARPLVPRFEKLDPMAGLKRMFLSPRAWGELLKAVVKMVIVGAIGYSIFRSGLAEILGSSRLDFDSILALAGALVLRLTFATLLALLAFSVFDLFYQRWLTGRDQKMSKPEYKRDMRSDFGRPEIKDARRRQQAEMISRCDLHRVENEATAVLVNPTHFACAIAYDGKSGAPRLIAKARDEIALGLRRHAEARGIPVRQDVRLARALYELEIDSEIPEELYVAVAVTLEWVRLVLESRGEKPGWIEDDEEDLERPATDSIGAR